MVILGIDPGTSRAGYGLIKKNGSRLSLIEGGLLKTTSSNQAERLSELSFHLKELISTYQPAVAGLEKLYFSKNTKTGLLVAESRGACLLILKNAGLPIFEWSPSEIKLYLTGYGNAKKSDVKRFVEITLGGQPISALDDTLDALAIAILTASSLKQNSLSRFS
jgi:crossover junction endodeoxyribonuclease RuvC